MRTITVPFITYSDTLHASFRHAGSVPCRIDDDFPEYECRQSLTTLLTEQYLSQRFHLSSTLHVYIYLDVSQFCSIEIVNSTFL